MGSVEGSALLLPSRYVTLSSAVRGNITRLDVCTRLVLVVLQGPDTSLHNSELELYVWLLVRSLFFDTNLSISILYAHSYIVSRPQNFSVRQRTLDQTQVSLDVGILVIGKMSASLVFFSLIFA